MATKKSGGRPHPARPPGGRPGGSAPATPRAAAGRGSGGGPVVRPNRVMLATAPLLTRLSALPRLVLPVFIAVLALAGLATGGIAGLLCLLLVAGLLGWLLAAFWPVTPGPGRVLRVLAILALVLVGVVQAL